MKCKQTLEDGDGIEDFFGVEVVAVVGVDVHGVAVGLFAVRGFDGQVLGRRIKVNAFDLPARTVFEHDAVAFAGVVVGDGARALPVQGVAAVQQVGEGVRACAAFLRMAGSASCNMLSVTSSGNVSPSTSKVSDAMVSSNRRLKALAPVIDFSRNSCSILSSSRASQIPAGS